MNLLWALVLGLLAGVREVQKELRPERPVTDLVPEVGKGSYAGISIRHLLDMRAGIVYDENYAETGGPIVEYRKAMGWNPVEPNDRPADVRSFLATLNEPSRPHGGPTNYVSPGTDLLGWALDFATGAVGLALLLCGWRLLRGPELPDRVLALDTMYINALALLMRSREDIRAACARLADPQGLEGAPSTVAGLGLLDIGFGSPELQTLATLALALVLFSDGVTLNIRELRPRRALLLRLAQRLRLGVRVRLEAGHHHALELELDGALDVGEQLQLVDADQ